MCRKILQLFFAAVFITSLSVPTVLADTQDGTMSGVVIDAGGIPLPGVTVTITGPVLQGERMAMLAAATRLPPYSTVSRR